MKQPGLWSSVSASTAHPFSLHALPNKPQTAADKKLHMKPTQGAAFLDAPWTQLPPRRARSEDKACVTVPGQEKDGGLLGGVTSHLWALPESARTSPKPPENLAMGADQGPPTKHKQRSSHGTGDDEGVRQTRGSEDQKRFGRVRTLVREHGA